MTNILLCHETCIIILIHKCYNVTANKEYTCHLFYKKNGRNNYTVVAAVTPANVVNFACMQFV